MYTECDIRHSADGGVMVTASSFDMMRVQQQQAKFSSGEGKKKEVFEVQLAR